MSDRFITRPADNARCRVCRQPILSGLSEGARVRVDRDPIAEVRDLDFDVEAAAIVTGHRTFVRLPNGELYERDQFRLAHNTLQGSIHVEHSCPGRAAIAGIGKAA